MVFYAVNWPSLEPLDAPQFRDLDHRHGLLEGNNSNTSQLIDIALQLLQHFVLVALSLRNFVYCLNIGFAAVFGQFGGNFCDDSILDIGPWSIFDFANQTLVTCCANLV